MMASPGPNQSIYRQIESQPDRKWEVMVIIIPPSPPSLFLCDDEKLPMTLGDMDEDEERNTSWETGMASQIVGGGGEEKKSTSWTIEEKSVEQNKRRVQEMTSHSPLFPLLPQMVQETVSGCRDTMGSAHIRCSPPQWQGPYTDMMCLTKAS